MNIFFIILVINILPVQSINISGHQNSQNTCNLNPHNESVIAIILARGGSKGVYRKNLRKINNISLLARNIIKLKKTQLFSEIWVSTEDKEIIMESIKYGALVHNRPKYLAQDQTSSLESVKEFLKINKHINKFALFQCTSIFLRQWQIELAYKLFEIAECVFAVTRIYKLRWHLNDNNYAIPLNFDPKNRPRRQDWNGELIETGMFYFSNRKLVEIDNVFQNDKCKIVEIPEKDALEIDNEIDLKIAEYLLKYE